MQEIAKTFIGIIGGPEVETEYMNPWVEGRAWLSFKIKAGNPSDPNAGKDEATGTKRDWYEVNTSGTEFNILRNIVQNLRTPTQVEVTWMHGRERPRAKGTRYQNVQSIRVLESPAPVAQPQGGYQAPRPAPNPAPSPAPDPQVAAPVAPPFACGHGVPYVGSYSESCGRCISRSGGSRYAMEFVKSSVGYEGLTIDQKMERYSLM